MKKIILLTSLFLTGFNCYAANPLDSTEEFKTDSKTGEALAQENNLEIRSLKVTYDNLSDDLNDFKICQAKHMLFIGKGVDKTDSQGCIDIQNRKPPARSRLPKFAGYLTERLKGNLKASGVVNTGSSTEPWGRLRADYLCSNQYTNARAMTYDDLKYMMYNLPWEGSDFSATSKDDKIWLFDAMGTNGAGVNAFSKNYVEGTGECDGWLVDNVTKRGVVLTLAGYLGRKYLAIGHSYCSNKELVACVYN